MPIIMSNPVKENRCGKFSIANKFIEDEPGIVMQILGMCVVVEATSRFMSNSIEYHAYSEHFEPLEQSRLYPEYDIIVRGDKTGCTISFEKLDLEKSFGVLRKISF